MLAVLAFRRNAGQVAAIAVGKERAANAGKAGGNGRLKESSLSVNVSDKLPKKDNRESVAKEARVPERKVRAVAEVKKKAPELVSKVRAGDISLAEAKRQMRKAELDIALNSVEAIEAKKLAGVYDVAVIDPPWPG